MLSNTATKNGAKTAAPKPKPWHWIDPHVQRLAGILLVLIIFFFIVQTGAFSRTNTWVSMGVQFPEYGIMALGVMLAMITGGIDLSVVGIANLSGILAAMTLMSMNPSGLGSASSILVAILVSLLVGLACGIVNGLLVAYVKIPPILVTLGTFELFTGLGIMLTGGKALSGLPLNFSNFFGARLGGLLPVQLLIFIVVAVAIGLLLHRTTFGAKLFMIGTNATAARFSGLKNERILIKTYAISGVCAAVAGLVMMANYNSAKPDYGAAYLLLTILIVVLGGVSPIGGNGNIFGVVLAVLILQVLASGLNTFPDISNFYRPLIYGAVLLLVVWGGDKGLFGFKKRKGKSA